MATSATITLKTKDGKYKSVYLHNDGYLEGAGYVLKTYYPTYEKVDQLLNLGNLSSLGRTPVDDPKLWDMDYWMELHHKYIGNNYSHPVEMPDNLKCRTYKGRGDQDEDALITDNLDDIIGNNCYDYLFENNKWYLIDNDGERVEF